MNLSQAFPEIAPHIAGAIEQLGNIPESLLQATEQSAQLIAQQLMAGGKLMLATSAGNRGLGDALCFDLLERYKQQQPSLPVMQLPGNITESAADFFQLAETLGSKDDVLLVMNDFGLESQSLLAEQLYVNRGIYCVYLGSPAETPIDTGFSVQIPLPGENKYRQLEMSLFILHCLSARIQSIVFRGC